MTRILPANKTVMSGQLISLVEHTEPVSSEWSQSRDGHEIPVFNGIPLHSTYSVSKEAQRQGTAISETADTVIAVGIGAGYHLAQLCQTKRIIAVPVNIPLFASIVSHIDMSVYLKNIVFIDESELYHNMYKIYADNLSAKVAVTVGSYFLSHEHQNVDRICKLISIASSSAKTEVSTICKFGTVWHNNIQKNLRHYFDGEYNFQSLVIRDKVILVAGAGYSLTQNIDFIRANRQMFYIASADTAATVLVREGIVPDSIWTFDAQNVSYQHFLCLSSIAQPVRIFADFCSPVYIHSENVTVTPVFSSHPYRRILETAGLCLRNIDSGCGNIGAAAVNFFKHYFSDVPIVTVGIDFAYYRGYSYSHGSYLDDYRMYKQDYYHSAQSLDTGITYRDKVIFSDNGDWQTSPLMQGYASVMNSDILTLSESPFCGMTHITEEAVLELQPTGEHKLDFNPGNISENAFRRMEKEYLERDKTPLLPAEMAAEMKKKKKK